jgi:hypothetical protein
MPRRETMTSSRSDHNRENGHLSQNANAHAGECALASSSSLVLEKPVRWFEDEDEDDGRGRKKTHEITDFVAKANWRFTKRPKRPKSSSFGGASSGSPQIPRVSIRKPGNQEKQIEMKIGADV